VVLGLLAAGFSTMEGILVALSSIFANDFVRNVLPAARRQLRRGRGRRCAGRAFPRRAGARDDLWLSWRQIADPSLSVAIFAQNGVYGLFAATFVPILFGIFRGRDKRWVFAASVTALLVHFGMYYGEVTMYHNNPAVPAALALLSSLAVGLAGAALSHRAGGAPRETADTTAAGR
jgi:sodium/pantothenate symporter